MNFCLLPSMPCGLKFHRHSFSAVNRLFDCVTFFCEKTMQTADLVHGKCFTPLLLQVLQEVCIHELKAALETSVVFELTI